MIEPTSQSGHTMSAPTTPERLRALVDREIEAIRNIPLDHHLVAAVDLIHRHVHQRGGKLVVSGIGKAGQIGHNIATTFSSSGTPAVFLHPGEAQHGDLGLLQPNDLLLLVSNSGKTREIIELQTLARKLVPDIPAIALTGHRDSELARAATIILSTGNPQEICPLGLTPTTSTTVMTVLGDLLIVALMEKIGFNKAEYAKRHHSGYLGQKAKEL